MKQMRLFLLTQDKNNDYDTYDSCVVCAEHVEDAKRINPGNFRKWSDEKGCWMFQYHDGKESPDKDSTWVDDLDQIEVTELGIAHKYIKPGIVCTSFNAG